MSHVHSALAKLCFFTVFQSKCSTAHQGQLPPTGEGCVPGAEGQRSKVRFPIETHTSHTPAETPSSPQAASVYEKKSMKENARVISLHSVYFLSAATKGKIVKRQ